MQPQPTQTGRKKILLWGAGLLAAAATFRFFKPTRKKSGASDKTETVKMLGQDGQLVEIDKRLLAASSDKISNEALQKWIKK